MAETQKAVDVNTVYSEMYTEMRRFRDYELRVSTWYTTILVAIVGFLAKQRFDEVIEAESMAPLSQKSVWESVLVLIIITALAFASCFSVWYASRRYFTLRDWMNENLEPEWTKSLRGKATVGPRHVIYIVQLLLLLVSYVIVLGS